MLKILCCQLRTYGDVVRTFPVIRALKEEYGHHIGFVCFEEMIETCSLNSNIDSIIPIPRLYQERNNQGNTRLVDCSPLELAISSISERQFDVYLDFHGVFQSALIGILSGIPHRIGRPKTHCKDGAHIFYTTTPSMSKEKINKFESHMMVAKTFFTDLTFPSSKAEPLFEKLVLTPGSSHVGILKRWDYAKYNELAERLAQVFKSVQYVLGPDENDLEEVLSCRKDNMSIRKVHNLIEFDAVLDNTSCVIGNDTSFLHLSVYRNVPVYMILGPTDPVINGPPAYATGQWYSLQLDCSKTCRVWDRQCRNDHMCLGDMSVDAVYKDFMSFYKSIDAL